jgi:hypothetical protein
MLKDIPPLKFCEIEGSVFDGEQPRQYIRLKDNFPDAVIALDEAEAIAIRDWLNQVLA